eukprot:s1573_g16.t4
MRAASLLQGNKALVAQKQNWKAAAFLLSVFPEVQLQAGQLWMRLQLLRRNLVIFSSCISGAKEASQWPVSLEYFRQMCSALVEYDTVSFNAALSALPQWLMAVHLIGLCGELRLDAFSYSSLLSLPSSTAWPLPLEWLHDMRRLPVAPDVFCGSSLLTSLRKESDWQLASRVLDSMTLQKIQGSSVMYTAASDWQMSLAQGLRATRNLAPMILSFESGWRRCVDFFWASSHRSPSIDVFSSSALMNQLQRWQQWDLALAQLEIFQGQGDQQLYHAGIAALKEASHWSPALSLFTLLPRRRVDLDSFGYAAAAPRQWRECSWLMQDMQQRSLERSMVLVGSVSAGHWSMTLQLLQWMLLARQDVDAACFNAAAWQQMSLAMQGYAGGSVDPGSSNLFDLHVQCMTGEGVTLNVSPSMLGREEEFALEGLTHLTLKMPVEYLHHLPESLEDLTLDFNSNEDDEGLDEMHMTIGLQTLTFGNRFNQSLKRVMLPLSLQTLTFGSDFNQSLERVTLPSSLQTLTFGDNFNHSLERVTLPSSLQTLTFGENFNHSLERVTLPSGLQTLAFGYQFNQSLKRLTLPPSLEMLTFGGRFNQSFEPVTLPPSLTTLNFGDRFNHSLERVTLPPSLQTLAFGSNFNQSLEPVTLPPSLQTLAFGSNFNHSMERVTLPSSLQTLTLGFNFNQRLEQVTLLPSLQTLTYCGCHQSLERVTFPSSLQTLTFGDNFNQSLERVTLPSSLQTLTFGKCFNQSFEPVTLPPSLTTLNFGDRFNHSLERVTLPPCLQTLAFGSNFNQSLEQVTLPPSLQVLTFGHNFNQSLKGVIFPEKLEELFFGWRFDQGLEGANVPSSLQTLGFREAVLSCRR